MKKKPPAENPPASIYDPELKSFDADFPIPPLPQRSTKKRSTAIDINGLEEELLTKEEPDEPSLGKVSADYEELVAEDPLEILEDPRLAVELSSSMENLATSSHTLSASRSLLRFASMMRKTSLRLILSILSC